MNQHRQQHRGGALVSALIAVIVIATMSLGLSSITMTSNGVVVDTCDQYNSLLLAQSGISIAFKKIDATFSTLANGAIVHSENFANNSRLEVRKKTNAGGMAYLESTGYVEKKLIIGNVQQVKRTIEAVVGVAITNGSFPAGAFGMNTLKVGGNFFSDSYDSSVGPYGGANISSMGDVGTNGSFTISGNSFEVKGNGRPGPGQPAVVSDNISGNKTPLDSAVTVVVAPYDPPTSGVINGIPNTGNIGSAGTVTNYQVSTLSLGKNDPLIVTGTVNLFVEGDITLQGVVQLANANAILNVWQRAGSITVNGGGELASGTITYVPAQVITLEAGSVTTDATVRYVAKDAQNGNIPPLNTGETYTQVTSGNGSKAVVVGWNITTLANTTLQYPITITEPARNQKAGANPSQFNIISQTTGAVKINGNSVYYGTLLAPYADLTVNGNANKFGAVLGKTMTLLGTGDFHYDLNAKSSGFVSKPMLRSYREILPPTY